MSPSLGYLILTTRVAKCPPLNPESGIVASCLANWKFYKQKCLVFFFFLIILFVAQEPLRLDLTVTKSWWWETKDAKNLLLEALWVETAPDDSQLCWDCRWTPSAQRLGPRHVGSTKVIFPVGVSVTSTGIAIESNTTDATFWGVQLSLVFFSCRHWTSMLYCSQPSIHWFSIFINDQTLKACVFLAGPWVGAQHTGNRIERSTSLPCLTARSIQTLLVCSSQGAAGS